MNQKQLEKAIEEAYNDVKRADKNAIELYDNTINPANDLETMASVLKIVINNKNFTQSYIIDKVLEWCNQ